MNRHFAQRIAAGTQAIAQIVEQQARLNRIEINQADSAILIVSKKKVGRFGVAMDNAATEFGSGQLEDGCPGTQIVNPLATHGFLYIEAAGLHPGGIALLKIVRGDVKARKRVNQPFRRDIRG